MFRYASIWVLTPEMSSPIVQPNARLVRKAIMKTEVDALRRTGMTVHENLNDGERIVINPGLTASR